MEEQDIVHGFPSDEFGYRHLADEYEAFRKTSKDPFYSFFVTIQNHSGYKMNPVDVNVSLKNKKQWGKRVEEFFNLQ